MAAREDGQLRTLLDSRARTICIVAKAHLWQVTDILRADPAENINMIYDSVSYLASQGRTVMVVWNITLMDIILMQNMQLNAVRLPWIVVHRY